MIMEHEAGRCRRTDGKKWRCSREVLPGQKYCERHIHRGRKRSRKYSEASLDSINPRTSTKHHVHVTREDTKPSESILVNNVKRNGIFNDMDRKWDGQKFSLDDNTYNDEKRKANENGYGDGNKGDKSNANVAALVIGFPPRSNLHVGGTNTSGNTLLTEEMRCKRTDGKKWRCRKEVVKYQKYCPNHMHRGAKRIGAVSKREKAIEVNTGLCISPAMMNLELMRRSSPSRRNGSSSDSTTITDENGCVCP